jgi:drug/metabolite transporter superfamily protein YnfA
MGLDAVWQQCAYTGYQVWVWLRDEASLHLFLFLGAVIVIVSAWALFKSEVRSK